MHFKFRNVNDAFKGLVSSIYQGIVPVRCSSSRIGEVLMVEEPVIVTYSHPRERVLFNQARDCNPFFHLFESLWMLAGRNDVAPLLYYNSHALDWSDDGKIYNGAYGYRWRYGARIEGCIKQTIDLNWPIVEPTDQLKIIVDQLKQKPESRRCVLQMWNVKDDLFKIDTTKDVCCNTHAYFALRPCSQHGHNDLIKCPECFLDITVCNRSNDMILGMLGANVVHFSILQEYMAACIGVEVGDYHQMTNNLHVYRNNWEPEKWLADPIYDSFAGYHPGTKESFLLVQYPEQFDLECARFIDSIDGDFQEPFLRDVAQPMMQAFHAHKERRYDDAFFFARNVLAQDWKTVANNWLKKRFNTYTNLQLS